MFIYTIVNRETLKQYIGQHKDGNLQKYLQRKYSAATHQEAKGSYLFYSMRKHPKEVWSIHPLLEVRTREEASEWERFYIKLFHVLDHEYGYNISSGGYQDREPEVYERIAAAHRGRKRSPEFCEMRRRIQTGTHQSPEQVAKRVAKLKNPSDETRLKHSVAMKATWAAGCYEASVAAKRGVPRPPELMAKLHSPEAQERSRVSRIGQKLSPQHCAGIAERKKKWWAEHPGFKFSAERNAKISAAFKGKVQSQLVRAAHSPEAERKRRVTTAGRPSPLRGTHIPPEVVAKRVATCARIRAMKVWKSQHRS